ncbi:MAG: SWIM zinc finger family protein [Gemmatimonadaceae bacterium]
MQVAANLDQPDAVDVARLERSLSLMGDRVGEGRYHFTGGAQEHWVDLYTTGHPRCDCGDHLWRERICKHILAALLREGNERVVRALSLVAERLRGRRAAA